MKARFHQQNGSMAEFAPALCILIAVLFPLIDMLGLGMSVGTAYFINSQAAQKAALAGSPANAVDAMFDELDNLGQSNFSKFANLKIIMPNRSVQGVVSESALQSSSTRLYVIRTNIINSAGGTEHTQAPPSEQFDPSTYIYEYYVLTTFQINPFISLQSIPGFSAIPGLGQPYNLKIASSRAIESTEPFDLNQNGPAWATGDPILQRPGSGGPQPSWLPGLPR